MVDPIFGIAQFGKVKIALFFMALGAKHRLFGQTLMELALGLGDLIGSIFILVFQELLRRFLTDRMNNVFDASFRDLYRKNFGRVPAVFACNRPAGNSRLAVNPDEGKGFITGLFTNMTDRTGEKSIVKIENRPYSRQTNRLKRLGMVNLFIDHVKMSARHRLFLPQYFAENIFFGRLRQDLACNRFAFGKIQQLHQP